MQSSLRPAVFNSSSQKGLLFDLLWGFFLLLPKQLQAWKGIRHRATSNLLACKKNRNVPGTKKKKKKGCEKVDGKRKEKVLVAFLIGFPVKSLPTYFAILSILGQIAMYLIYYALSRQTEWPSSE